MKKISSNLIFILGFLAVAVGFVPYLILGQDAIFIYHDQLDGELIAYLLHARHWGESGVFNEFMGGQAVTALTLPAPLFTVLFSVVDAHLALALMQLVGSLVGYLGMYLLMHRLWKQLHADGQVGWMMEAVMVIVSAIYAYLPFLPVYGLSQYGIPMLLYSVLCICTGRRKALQGEALSAKRCFVSCLPWMYVVLYGLGSSLVLCGFGLLAAGVVAGVWLSFLDRKYSWRLWGATALLLFIYIVENLPLLGQMLVGNGVVSHKEEYVLHGVKFLPAFWENLTLGKVHTNDFHHLFFVGIIVAFVAFLMGKRNRKLVSTMGILIGSIVSIALLSALWDCNAGVLLRQKLGSLGSFQCNRLLWMTPALWYLLLALGMLGMIGWMQEKEVPAGGILGKKVLPVAILCLLAGMTLITGGKVLWNSHLKPNAIKIVNEDDASISFSDYYAIGVMEQVEAYLQETTGKEKSEYRVVSFGIDPAAALYHGFYCLDGYSNNYDLAYKQAFRKVIAPELARNDYIRQSFDDWGNRCYLFSSECPGYYTIQKGGFYLKDYQIDTQALSDIAGTDCYLFSAAYIENADSQGLALMRQLPFEAEDSYYRIFLYRVEAESSDISDKEMIGQENR